MSVSARSAFENDTTGKVGVSIVLSKYCGNTSNCFSFLDCKHS